MPPIDGTQYYYTLSIKLEELLLGIKATASGIAEHSVQGNVGKVGTGIAMLGKLLSLVPLADTAAGVVEGAGAAVQVLDHKRMQNMLERVSRIGTLTDLRRVCESVAQTMTHRYAPQLKQLLTLQQTQTPAAGAPKPTVFQRVKKSLAKAKDVVLLSEPISPSEALAEFTLALVWDLLQEPLNSAVIPPNQSLDETILHSICVAARLPTLTGLRGLIAGAAKSELVTTTNAVWRMGEVFVCPGVLMPTKGAMWDGGAVMKPALYGYCFGEDEEQPRRKLVACSVVAKDKHPGARTAQPHSKFVNQTAQLQKDQADKVELLKKQADLKDEQHRKEMAELQAKMAEILKKQHEDAAAGTGKSAAAEAEDLFFSFDENNDDKMQLDELQMLFKMEADSLGQAEPDTAVVEAAFRARAQGEDFLTLKQFQQLWIKIRRYGIEATLKTEAGQQGASPPPSKSPPAAVKAKGAAKGATAPLSMKIAGKMPGQTTAKGPGPKKAVGAGAVPTKK